MLFGFQYIDPLAGEYPPETARVAQELPARMRTLLAARSRLEIEQLIELVNFVLEDIGRPAVFKSLLLKAKLVDSDEPIAAQPCEAELNQLPRSSNPTDVLRWTTEHVELSSFAPEDHFTWYELFAALALALLDRAADDELYYGSWAAENHWLHEWRILNHVAHWAIQAERAASLAESLKWGLEQASKRHTLEEARKQDERSAISAAKRQAAYKRHAQTSSAILALTKFYRDNGFKSMSRAAKLFCERNPDLVKHLSVENRVRTLREGLSRQLKEIGHVDR